MDQSPVYKVQESAAPDPGVTLGVGLGGPLKKAWEKTLMQKRPELSLGTEPEGRPSDTYVIKCYIHTSVWYHSSWNVES